MQNTRKNDLRSDAPPVPQFGSCDFEIRGMTCQACANRIEKVLNKKPYIQQVVVNFATETMTAVYDTGCDIAQIVADIEKVGFHAAPIDTQTTRANLEPSSPIGLYVLWLLSLPFWVAMVAMMFGAHQWMLPVAIQFILASLVQVGFGWRFYQGAYASLKNRTANMDVLVALGTTAIWAYSTYAWLTYHDAQQMVYFEASVMIIAFVRLGKYLEQRTKKHSLNSLALLSELLPHQVVKKTDDGYLSIPLTQVQLGDVLQAKSGDVIAADGAVAKGMGLCDESHLTGESALLSKQVGDLVSAGSKVVDGSFVYQVRALKADTQLGEMMRALAHAQGSKAKIARFADQVAAVFVPAVVWMAIVCFLVNFYAFEIDFQASLMRAVSVLVIACPCALGLATPAAIMAGMGAAARHGVLFLDAASLEAAGAIDTIVFDKTGTLTTGTPTLGAIQILQPAWQENEVLRVAASLEKHANHPLARAIVATAQARGLSTYTVDDVHHEIGAGVSGQMSQIGRVVVGMPQFVGVTERELSRWHELFLGASLVAISVNDVPIAILALQDTLKANSVEIVNRIKRLGIQVLMMSGDRKQSVQQVANQLNISAMGEMTPTAKLEAIEALIQQNHRVAMVGDGVNDAPAMARAHASFAVAQATDITKQTASARLLGDSLSDVYFAQVIARKTLHIIKQNLFFAFVYNCVGILLAFMGYINPMIAAAAMAASSLSVLLNALRLQRVELT